MARKFIGAEDSENLMELADTKEKKRNIKIYRSNSDGKVLQYLCEHFELCKSLLFRMIHCQLQVAAVTDILSFIITILS